MKIAMVASPFLPVPPLKYGGTERVIYYLIKGLKENGHEVVLLASGDSTIDCELIPICDKHISFGITDQEQNEVEAQARQIEQKTWKILEELADQVDVVHSHGFDLAKFTTAPQVTTLHGKFTLERIDYFSQRSHVPFVSISNNQRESFPDLNYVGTAYNGLDPKEFPIVHKPDDYLCFIGRLDREKNPHSAILLALQANMKLILAGKIDFQGREYFETEVKPYLDHPLIEYIGEIGMEEKIELVSKAKCNLHPTGFREPFGLTVLEAAYCGTPTLAIAKGSMPELIEEGRTGVLVEDYAEGFHYLADCLNMDRKYIAQRSRLLFNYQNMTSQYEEAYKIAIDQYQNQKDSNVISPKKNRLMANSGQSLNTKSSMANPLAQIPTPLKVVAHQKQLSRGSKYAPSAWQRQYKPFLFE